MEFSLYKHAVLGFHLKEEDFLRTKKVRICNHKTDESLDVCSICGKDVWKINKENILEGDLKNYVVYDVGGAYSYEKIVGVAVDNNNDEVINVKWSEIPNKENIEIIKKDLIIFLNELGIDVIESDFGFQFGVFQSS